MHNAIFCSRFFSSYFLPFVILVSAKQVWWFVYWSGGEKEIMCVLLNEYWVMGADDSLKDSHVSTRTSELEVFVIPHSVSY